MGYPPLKEEADASSGSLTSYELLERAHFRLMRTARRSADALTLEEVLAVWHELGFEVARQLRARRGVRLPGLGTFAMAKTGAPFFHPNYDGATQWTTPNDIGLAALLAALVTCGL